MGITFWVNDPIEAELGAMAREGVTLIVNPKASHE